MKTVLGHRHVKHEHRMRYQRSSVQVWCRHLKYFLRNGLTALKILHDNDDNNDDDLAITTARLFLRNRRAKS